MKEQLVGIFNTLKMVETRGDSSILMADCLRAMAQVISTIPEKEDKEETK